MANYSLTTPTFEPMTFQELMAPITTYNEMYKDNADKLEAMQEIANPFETLLTEADGDTYKLSKLYNLKLNDYARRFGALGFAMSGGRVKALMLKNLFNKVMKPIEKAYKKRDDEQAKLIELNIKAGGNLISDRSPTGTPLDNYYKDPTYTSLGKIVDGRDITNEAFKLASTLATQLRNPNSPGKKLGYIDLFHYRLKDEYGVSKEDVAFAILNPYSPYANKALMAIVDVITDRYKDWNPQALNLIKKYALEGLYGAIGKETLETITDEGRKMRYQAAVHAAQLKKLMDLSRPPTVIDIRTGLPRRLVTERDMKNQSEYGNFKQYFYSKNGTWRMTTEGRKRFFKELKEASIDRAKGRIATRSKDGISRDYRFLQFVVENKLTGLAQDRLGPWQSSRLQLMHDNYTNNKDATVQTEYVQSLASVENVVKTIRAMLGGNELPVYKKAGLKGGKIDFLNTGKKVDLALLTPDKVASASTVYGLYGAYIELTLKPEKTGQTKPEIVIVPIKEIASADYMKALENYNANATNIRNAIDELRKQYGDAAGNLLVIDSYGRPVVTKENKPLTWNEYLKLQIHDYGRELGALFSQEKAKDIENSGSIGMPTSVYTLSPNGYLLPIGEAYDPSYFTDYNQ